MDTNVMVQTVAILSPAEVSAGLRVVDVLERAGQMTREEAAEWRRRLRGRLEFLEMEPDAGPAG